MKNIMIVDGAINCVYDIFQVCDEIFNEIFPEGIDVEFEPDLFNRLGSKRMAELSKTLWIKRIPKKDAMGIHGVLFYDEALCNEKRKYYPTKKDEEALPSVRAK